MPLATLWRLQCCPIVTPLISGTLADIGPVVGVLADVDTLEGSVGSPALVGQLADTGGLAGLLTPEQPLGGEAS